MCQFIEIFKVILLKKYYIKVINMESEPQTLSEKLKHLQQWFGENPKLPKKINMTLLERFLKCMNGDIGDTKQLLELNYHLRNKSPNIFINRDPNDELTKKSFQVIDIVPLPGVTPDHNKVILFRLNEKDIKLQNSIEQSKVSFLISDARCLYPDIEDHKNKNSIKDMDSLASGEIHIVDIGNYSLRHIASMSLTTMRVYTHFLQQAYPVRLKAMHLINCPSYLNAMMAITRPFIQEEVYKMMHFHTKSVDEIYDYVPRNMLPAEYGGKAGPLSDLKTNLWNIIIKNRDYLMDPDHWVVDKTETKNIWRWW